MNTIVAVGMVKDEADVLERTLRHLEPQVDRIHLLDNGSLDGTLGILDDLEHEFGAKLVVHDDPEVAYYQARKMTDLAARVATLDDWIVPFDADELLFGIDRLRFLDDVRAVEFRGVDHILAPDFDELVDAHPIDRMTWRRSSPASYRPKVAFRWQPGAELAQGNHSVRVPGVGRLFPLALAGVGTRHFPVRSLSQFQRKARNGARAYEATDLPAGVGAHWRGWGRLPPSELAAVFESLYIADRDLDVEDPAPWTTFPF